MAECIGLYFDALETRDPAEREAALFAALPDLLAHAAARTAYFRRLLAGVNPQEVRSRAALAALPVTRKSDLTALQGAEPPLGGLCATPPGQLARLFVSPGPIYDVEGYGRDYWRTARVLYAAGMRAGDILHNAFSYHLTPAGAMFESGAHALGCAVIPAGVGQSELQIATIAALRPRVYAGTPSFLKILLEKADESRTDVTSLQIAVLSGEAFLSPVRDFLAARGVAACQAYGTADVGMIAYETPARQGMTVEEGVIVEIVRPGSGDPVAEGEIGEVLVTSFARDYPLIRFATGDLSALLPGSSPCGRTNMRIRGWLGRADQATKVRGLFVHPQQVATIVARHPQIARARLVVSHADGEDVMTLCCECIGAPENLATALAQSIREVTKLRGAVNLVAAGTLANDGKVIEDRRSVC